MINQFRNDLEKKGEPCERAVLEKLKLKDKDAHKIEGYFKDYDIICPNLKETYEVKNCQDAIINIPIEVRCNDKPSGIKTTKANFWVIFCKGRYFKIKTDILKNLTNHLKIRKFNLFGQDVEMKLIKIEDLIEFSEVI
jgi:hypothetical protein